MTLPSKKGYFGEYGGKFIPETLMPALDELEAAYNKFRKDKKFLDEFNYYLKYYVGRPTPIYFAENLTKYLGGAKIYIKREDLNHTGAHKINNALGQALLAKRLGKTRLIAETGAGQHGVATATVAALFKMKCDVFMGTVDMERQALNVFRMKMIGTNVVPVSSGSKTLKDATNEAMRNWVATVNDTHYIIGSVVGPHPFPRIVRDFQSMIGRESKQQMKKLVNKLPDYIVACVGGGSNSVGMFYPFIDEKKVKLIGVEAAGEGVNTDKHSATLTKGKPGVLHGCFSYLLQDDYGQVLETHSISAGLDYPGVGPEHSHYKDTKKVEYVSATDKEVLDAFLLLSREEGIVPALESSHAVAYVVKLAPKLPKNKIILINLSGRGDKDVPTIAKIIK